MISEATFFGDSRAQTLVADTAIGEADVRVIVYELGAARNATLPPLTTQKRGGPRFYIVNNNLVFALQLKRSDGTNLQSIAGAEVALLIVGITDWVVTIFQLHSGATS